MFINSRTAKEERICMPCSARRRQMESLAIWVNKETNDLFCRSVLEKVIRHKIFMYLQIKHYLLSSLN